MVFKIMQEYFLKFLNDKKVRISHIGGTISETKTLKYDDFKLDGSEAELTLHDQKLIFYISDEENAKNRYILIDIERRATNSDDKPKIVTKKKIKIDQKQRIEQFFDENPLELMAVRQFCKIEGVISIENVRYEIRRIMNCGDVYHVWIEDLYDILQKRGFVMRPLK